MQWECLLLPQMHIWVLKLIYMIYQLDSRNLRKIPRIIIDCVSNYMLTESNFLVVSDSALALLALYLLVVEEYIVLLLECFFVLYHNRVS